MFYNMYYAARSFPQSYAVWVDEAPDLNDAKTKFVKQFPTGSIIFYGMEETPTRPDGSLIIHNDGVWIKAQIDQINARKTSEYKTLTLFETTKAGVRKKAPDYPVEAHQDKEKFKNVDYMGAVRFFCESQIGARMR